MATLLDLNFDTGSGATSAAGAANGAYQFTAMETTGTFDAAAAHYGAKGVRSSSSTSTYGYFDVSGKVFTVRFAFKIVGTVPTSDTYMIRLGVGTTRYVSLHINSAGKLRVSDASGTTGVFTSTATLVADKWYWCVLSVDTGTTSSNGTIKFDYYEEWNTTATESYNNTAANAGSGVTLTRIYVGKYTTAFQIDYDNVLITDTITNPGRYTPAAAASAGAIGGFLSNAGATTIFGTGVYTVEQALGDGSDTTGIRFADSASASKTCKIRLKPLTQGTNIVETPRAKLATGSASTYLDMVIYQGATVVATRTITVTSESAADFPQTALTAGELANITWTSGSAELDVVFTSRSS